MGSISFRGFGSHSIILYALMLSSLCGIFAFTQLSAVIIKAPTLGVIENHISNLDENALVVFDVDYTLLVPMDCILAPAGEEHFQKFMKKLRDLQEEGEILGSRISLQAQVTLVDKKILSLLKSLKQRHVKVIALTAMPTGRLGDVSNAEEWRVRQLASLGIYLDWSFHRQAANQEIGKS